jgi:hypothetical protein
MMRIRMALAALALLALPASMAQAQDLPLKAFFGHYQGNGIAESSDSLYFGVTMRDMDVVIEPSAQGFFVTWTTVIRQGGDPNNPDIRRKGTEIEFLPGEGMELVFRRITDGQATREVRARLVKVSN